jgi:hypothetical protein
LTQGIYLLRKNKWNPAMRTYSADEGYFEILEGWGDRPVNDFSVSDEAPGDFPFIITRDNLEDRQNFESYVEEQLAALSKTLSQFKLFRKHPTSVDRLPALSADFARDKVEDLVKKEVLVWRQGAKNWEIFPTGR